MFQVKYVRYWELTHRNEVGLSVCVWGGSSGGENSTEGEKTGSSNQICLLPCEGDQRVRIGHYK